MLTNNYKCRVAGEEESDELELGGRGAHVRDEPEGSQATEKKVCMH